jgi:3-methyladenine DNA glycosylase AlkD
VVGRVTCYTTHFLKLSSSKTFNNTCSFYLFLIPREFEKRASFAIIAAYCMADKKADNAVFEQFFPLIHQAADDDRIYVKKAVNWALRNIGKRNIDLNKRAIEEAHKIEALEYKSAKWIARDALRALQKEVINILDYPRAIYRP